MLVRSTIICHVKGLIFLITHLGYNQNHPQIEGLNMFITTFNLSLLKMKQTQ